MAGVNVLYDTAKFSWVYTPGAAGTPVATEFRLKWGTTAGNYTNAKVFPTTSTGAPLNTVLPAGSTGQFYACIVAVANTKEGTPSVEVPFVAGDGSPVGSWTFSIA